MCNQNWDKMGKRAKTKSDLNVKTYEVEKFGDHTSQADSQAEESDEYEAAPKYDPILEKRIEHQTNMALIYLFFYSFLMFTLPFGSYFLTRHFLSKHTDYEDTTVTTLSVVSAIVTVYVIIGLYVYHGYNEIDVVVPEQKREKKKKQKKK